MQQVYSIIMGTVMWGARGWGTMLQAGRSLVQFAMRLLDFFNLPNPSSRTMALGSTQPLTEMSTRNLPGGNGRPADNLTAICEPIVYKNVGTSTSHSPTGLHGPLQGYLYFNLYMETLKTIDEQRKAILNGSTPLNWTRSMLTYEITVCLKHPRE
jgi:hypothetical protein